MRSPFGGGSDADGSSCQTRRTGTTVAAHASAAGRRHRGSRWSASRASGIPSSTQHGLARADLGQRQPGDELRAGGDVRGQPAVHPGERERHRRQHRLEQRADQCKPEERSDRERDEGVGKQRVDRDGSELQPENRRRCRPTRGRHCERVAQPGRHRISLERKPELRQQQEDRADGGEGELEARLEQAGRRPREQDRRAECEEVPAIARAGERATRARPGRLRLRRARPTVASRPRGHRRRSRRSPRPRPRAGGSQAARRARAHRSQGTRHSVPRRPADGRARRP